MPGLPGCVASVTTLINAEAGQAGTTFVLSNCRSLQENADVSGRTSVEEHPIFGAAVHGGGLHGAPLVAGHETLEPAPPGDSLDAGGGPTINNGTVTA